MLDSTEKIAVNVSESYNHCMQNLNKCENNLSPHDILSFSQLNVQVVLTNSLNDDQ